MESVKAETVDGKKVLQVVLRYVRRKPALTDLKLISKPSLRIYIEAKEINSKQGRAETTIISTNVGVMTGREAVKKNLGGELLFKIW